MTLVFPGQGINRPPENAKATLPPPKAGVQLPTQLRRLVRVSGAAKRGAGVFDSAFRTDNHSGDNCSMVDHPVHRNEAAHRFEAALGKTIAKIDYAQSNGRLNLLHTEVPAEDQGQGIGSELAKAALEYALAEQLQVVPTCPFITTYIKDHPEYLEMVAPEYRRKIEQK